MMQFKSKNKEHSFSINYGSVRLIKFSKFNEKQFTVIKHTMGLLTFYNPISIQSVLPFIWSNVLVLNISTFSFMFIAMQQYNLLGAIDTFRPIP